MSAALARQWDFYDDEDDDLDDVETDVEEGLEDTFYPGAMVVVEEYEDEIASDYPALPQPFSLIVPKTVDVRPFSYDPSHQAGQPAANWHFFGDGGELTAAPAEAQAVYAYGYQESLPRRDWADTLAGLWYSLSRNWLVLGAIGLVLAWLVISNVLGWLTHKDDGATEIYNFGASGAVAPATTNSGPDSNLPPPAVAPGAHGVQGQPTVSVAKIEAILQQYHSPAIGKGQAIYDLGVKYGIDPAYALAFFVHESSAGTQGVAVTTKSIGNIRYTSDSGFENYQNFRKYPSWEAGIEDWYKLISNLYVKSWGLKTVEAIIPRYAPTADRNNPPQYINQVNSLVESWRNTK
jgi:hypothetical protein